MQHSWLQPATRQHQLLQLAAGLQCDKPLLLLVIFCCSLRTLILKADFLLLQADAGQLVAVLLEVQLKCLAIC